MSKKNQSSGQPAKKSRRNISGPEKLIGGASKIDITKNPDDLLTMIATMAGETLSFDRLTISLPSEQFPDGLQIALVTGRDDEFGKGREFAAADVWHGEVHRQAQGVITGNGEAGFLGRFRAGDQKGSWVRSFLGVPIMEAGLARGTLALESAQPNHYGPEELRLLTVISQVYGTAYWWARRYQHEHANAMVDGLTELLNHRSFMYRLEEELERATRYGDPMTLFMIDLDDFKQTNDTYGHLHGDFVLSEVARLIRSGTRITDVAGRIGGEEFGVIAINASKRKSRSTAQRIKSSVAKNHFTEDGVKSRMTASIGMAEYPTDAHNIK
ncbi:MAG: sensor domain-containing diguanylate cyclase, partial [Candidatus Neomarinimicrobiota bacterium]